ncbi:hypothetical protein VTP01DRAFT_7081 [Rhizomucor pusillus]|uniref:uncharacterized protein n=1 Tax=Rhizomucor pusillus TaxID=4840 RepID=UPI003741F5A5
MRYARSAVDPPTPQPRHLRKRPATKAQRTTLSTEDLPGRPGHETCKETLLTSKDFERGEYIEDPANSQKIRK